VSDMAEKEVRDLDSFIDGDILPDRREVTDKKRQASYHVAKFEGALKRGDLDEALKVLGRLEAALQREVQAAAALRERIAGYALESYLQTSFHGAFVKACAKHGLVVQGSFPRYEVFPFRIRVLADDRSIEVNERKVRIFRPEALAEYLSRRRSQLESAFFDAQRFVDALASVYDLIVHSREAAAGTKLGEGLELPLMAVYETLTLLPSQRKAYPVNMFAFDLHRLFVADLFKTSDGRTLILGDTRLRGQRIVTYDKTGREHRFGSLRFEGQGTSGAQRKSEE